MEITPKFRHRGSRLVLLLLFVLLVWIFRVQLLRGAGNFLIREDEHTSTPVLVVLGGNSLERGSAALQLWRGSTADHLVCTGGNVPSALEAAGVPMYEAELTAAFLRDAGVPHEALTTLTGSTSTFEEAQEVRQWCLDHSITEITVLSSRFHTRRVRKVFRKAFKDSGINLHIAGAPSLTYNENEWWKSEEGLIMVNNEYMKSLYYLFKH